jgi:hypothetical protein
MGMGMGMGEGIPAADYDDMGAVVVEAAVGAGRSLLRRVLAPGALGGAWRACFCGSGVEGGRGGLTYLLTYLPTHGVDRLGRTPPPLLTILSLNDADQPTLSCPPTSEPPILRP